MRDKEVVHETREHFLRARLVQVGELKATRNFALRIVGGVVLALAASLGELVNLFNYWRTSSEDRFGDLSAIGYATTSIFSFASFVALAYAVHAGLKWMRGQDENPPLVSVTIGLLSLALSVAFPIYQTGGVQNDLLLRCLFSLLFTVVAGLAINHMTVGFSFRDRHNEATEAIASLDEGLHRFILEKRRETSRPRRMDDYETELKESYSLAFVQAHDDALDSLTLAVNSEGLPVAPIDARMQRMIVGRGYAPQVEELINLTAGNTAIGLHRRLANRSMTDAEVSAVRRFLEVVQRPTQADVLRALNA